LLSIQWQAKGERSGSATLPPGSSPVAQGVALLFLSCSLGDAGREPGGLEGEQDHS